MSRQQAPSNRPVWLAIIVIFAVLAAAGAGLALHLAKASPAAALTGAGAAFVATMTLGMGASRFLSLLFNLPLSCCFPLAWRISRRRGGWQACGSSRRAGGRDLALRVSVQP